ncbi:hypothetical protein N9J26_00605 [bacterium]|nr:hypothetical protein [bacterium]
MIFRFLPLAFFMALLYGCSNNEQSQHFIIDKSQFSNVYPAVWFSASKGKIIPVSDDVKKRADYIWIEPRDPEIRAYNEAGFIYLGDGTAYDQAKQPEEENIPLARKPRMDTDHNRENGGLPATFLFINGDQAYAMRITRMSREDEVIEFDWKKLP